MYFLCLFIGDRSAEELMTPIANQRSEFNFDYTVFCPNLISNAGKGATAYRQTYLFSQFALWILWNFSLAACYFFTMLAFYINEEFC